MKLLLFIICLSVLIPLSLATETTEDWADQHFECRQESSIYVGSSFDYRGYSIKFTGLGYEHRIQFKINNGSGYGINWSMEIQGNEQEQLIFGNVYSGTSNVFLWQAGSIYHQESGSYATLKLCVDQLADVQDGSFYPAPFGEFRNSSYSQTIDFKWYQIRPGTVIMRVGSSSNYLSNVIKYTDSYPSSGYMPGAYYNEAQLDNIAYGSHYICANEQCIQRTNLNPGVTPTPTPTPTATPPWQTPTPTGTPIPPPDPTDTSNPLPCPDCLDGEPLPSGDDNGNTSFNPDFGNVSTDCTGDCANATYQDGEREGTVPNTGSGGGFGSVLTGFGYCQTDGCTIDDGIAAAYDFSMVFFFISLMVLVVKVYAIWKAR